MGERAAVLLDAVVREYLERQELVLIATVDRAGACHASVQSGPPGFVRILDDTTLMIPRFEPGVELPGLDDAVEAAPIALRFVDSFRSDLTVHISGRARLIDHAAVEAFAALLRRTAGIEQIVDIVDGRPLTPARWVLVDVVEARVEGTGPAPVNASPPEVVDDDELTYLLPPAWVEASPAA